MKPQYYYEWGDEPAGYVSTGLYIDDVWKSTGIMLKTKAKTLNLKNHCPYA